MSYAQEELRTIRRLHKSGRVNVSRTNLTLEVFELMTRLNRQADYLTIGQLVESLIIFCELHDMDLTSCLERYNQSQGDT